MSVFEIFYITYYNFVPHKLSIGYLYLMNFDFNLIKFNKIIICIFNYINIYIYIIYNIYLRVY